MSEEITQDDIDSWVASKPRQHDADPYYVGGGLKLEAVTEGKFGWTFRCYFLMGDWDDDDQTETEQQFVHMKKEWYKPKDLPSLKEARTWFEEQKKSVRIAILNKTTVVEATEKYDWEEVK